MGFKELKVLVAKEKRVYFFFLFLLILAFLSYQFEETSAFATCIFMFLPHACIIYLFFHLIFRKNTNKFAYILLPLSFLLAHPLQILIRINDIANFLYVNVLFYFSIFFWIYITAIFTMNNAYNLTLKWDIKIKKWSKSYNYLVRGGLFLGGALIATLLLFGVSYLILTYVPHTNNLFIFLFLLRIFMLIPIWILFTVGVASLFFDKKYLWLGTYFLISALFALNLMIKGARAEYSFLFNAEIILLQIAGVAISLYFFLGTCASLVGEQSVLIAKRIKIIKPDSILLVLILSMAIWENVAGIEPYYANLLSLLLIIEFFPILVGAFGVYAIYNYHRKFKKKKILDEGTQINKVEITEEQSKHIIS